MSVAKIANLTLDNEVPCFCLLGERHIHNRSASVSPSLSCLEVTESQSEGGVEALSTAALKLTHKDVSSTSFDLLFISICPSDRGGWEVRVHMAGQSVVSSSDQRIRVTRDGDYVLKSCTEMAGHKSRSCRPDSYLARHHINHF